MVEHGNDRVAATKEFADVVPLEGEEESSIDLVAAAHALYRGARTIAVVTLVAFVAATAVAFLLPARYTSVASFIPPSLGGGGGSMAAALAGQISSLGAGDLLGAGKTSGDLYAGILQSRLILKKLVNDFALTDLYKVKKESQAEEQLASNTAIAIDAKSTIVTLSVTDKSPERAHDLAKAYIDALQDANGSLALAQSSQRRQFFGEQLAREKDDLENAEVELKKTEEQSGLIAPSGQTEAEIATIAQTQAQIAVREVQLASLRDSATEQNSDVIRLRSEIADLQGQLARLQHGNDSKSTATIPTAKVPEAQLEYVRREREVKYHEALFDMLSRQYEAARLDEARDAPVLQVLDAASYPDKKSSPRRTYYVAGGLIAGFLGSCFWVLVRERVKTFWDVLRRQPAA